MDIFNIWNEDCMGTKLSFAFIRFLTLIPGTRRTNHASNHALIGACTYTHTRTTTQHKYTRLIGIWFNVVAIDRCITVHECRINLYLVVTEEGEKRYTRTTLLILIFSNYNEEVPTKTTFVLQSRE